MSYARHHAGRLPVVLAARFGRVWSFYKPFAIPEGRSVRVQKLGRAGVLRAAAAGRRGGVPAAAPRGSDVDPVGPVIIVAVTALTTYGNLRFREPAEIALVVLAAVALDAVWRRRAEA